MTTTATLGWGSSCLPATPAPEVDLDPADIGNALATFDDYWSPKVVARLNDYEVKLAKFKGEFVWHSHPDTDELFLVVAGNLVIQLRTGDVRLAPGQLYVVPRGVEHCPITDGQVSAILIEPTGVVNTGDVVSELTAGYAEITDLTPTESEQR